MYNQDPIHVTLQLGGSDNYDASKIGRGIFKDSIPTYNYINDLVSLNDVGNCYTSFDDPNVPSNPEITTNMITDLQIV